jgi:methyltransferase (TIGR00027 family)
MREDRPSSTATLIAAATALLARDALVSDLVPAGAAERCARYLESVSPLWPKALRALSHPALRWAARLAERATVPGLPLHFILRKRWIGEAVRAALVEGCEQVVVVGAGFDTLAPRLSNEFPRASFIEIDHPATQARKRLAVEPSRNLHLIATDLSRDRLQDALAADGRYRPDARSIFVIEGLLMYLTDPEVVAVFAAVRALQRAGGRVVFTVMEPAPDGRLAFHNATPLATRLLARWSEPFRSALPRNEAAAFLSALGFRFRELADSGTLCKRYLALSGREALALAQGELIVLAESQ